MAFDDGQKVVLKINDVQVEIGKVVLGNTNRVPPCNGQVFVRALRVDNGLDQLVIDYPHIRDCIGDNVGSPIPWAIENMMICSNEVFETFIDSLGERTYFACDDDEMTGLLNLEVKMP